MTRADQQDALTCALQGDDRARGALLESFRPYVRLLVSALRKGRAPGRLDDSDLIQDALFEAHRQFAQFRGSTVAELAAWLRPVVLRAAGHTLRGHLGTGKRDAGREHSAEGLEELSVDPGSSPSGQAMRHEMNARLAERLARLPDDMQQVLLGRHMDDLSYAELAEQMGRSEAALRVLYTRALRRLREECEAD
jgi:RNA polymerase sigma-70 factor (ECF subfamily)